MIHQLCSVVMIGLAQDSLFWILGKKNLSYFTQLNYSIKFIKIKPQKFAQLLALFFKKMLFVFLMEFSAKNRPKIYFFAELKTIFKKLQGILEKTQGFANSSWFSVRVNVQ